MLVFLQTKQLLPSMEFGRRLAQEKELDRSEFKHSCNLGKCLFYTVHLYLTCFVMKMLMR